MLSREGRAGSIVQGWPRVLPSDRGRQRRQRSAPCIHAQRRRTSQNAQGDTPAPIAWCPCRLLVFHSKWPKGGHSVVARSGQGSDCFRRPAYVSASEITSQNRVAGMCTLRPGPGALCLPDGDYVLRVRGLRLVGRKATVVQKIRRQDDELERGARRRKETRGPPAGVTRGLSRLLLRGPSAPRVAG